MPKIVKQPRRVKARKHQTCNYCTCDIEPADGYKDTVIERESVNGR